MPLYEYVLRVDGRADETLISDRNGLSQGQHLIVRNVGWQVVDIETAPTPKVAARITLVRARPMPVIDRA